MTSLRTKIIDSIDLYVREKRIDCLQLNAFKDGTSVDLYFKVMSLKAQGVHLRLRNRMGEVLESKLKEYDFSQFVVDELNKKP